MVGYPSMILLCFLITASIAALVYAPIAPGVWPKALVLVGGAFGVLAGAQFLDQAWERYNHHIKRWHSSRIDPYRQFADSIRHLTPGTIDWMNRLMLISMRVRVGMDISNEVYVARTYVLPMGDEEDGRFIWDYLMASKFYSAHREPGAFWPELHHTARLVAPVKEYLGDWSNLETRIKNLQDAFIYWQFAYHRIGEPCRLMEGCTYDQIAETLQLARLENV